jgi:uncharacterized protein (UPF0335 family)
MATAKETTAIAVAVEVANNQQTFNLDLKAIHTSPIQIQQIIGAKVKTMLERFVHDKYYFMAMNDGITRDEPTFSDDAGTSPVEDANEFRKWLWVYMEMTDTMVHYTGRPMNLRSYLMYKVTKIEEDIAVAQRKRHLNTVAELKKERRSVMDNAKDLLAEAESIELDRRYPEGFYEVLTECLNLRLEQMHNLSKPYPGMDADQELILGLIKDIS